MEVIKIAEGIVTLENISTVKTVKLSDFKEHLLQASGIRTPILPPNTVFYSSKGSTKIYLLEKEPAMVRIHYSNARGNATQFKEFMLPFPYHYFLIELEEYAFENCYFFFRNQRLTSINDRFSFPPLPNLHEDTCAVCLGYDFKVQVNAEIGKKIGNMVDYFFASTFNNDLDLLFTEKVPQQILSLKQQREHTFDAWQRLRLENVCSVEWFQGDSLAKRVDDILGGDD